MNDLVLNGEREAVASLPGHVIAAFDFAIGLWPNSVAPGSTAVRIAWAPALMRYSYEEICNALDRLALSGDFPAKHQLVTLLRELFPRQSEAPRLTRGAPGTMREGVRMWRDSELLELADRAANGLDDAAATAQRETFLARARALFPAHADLFASATSEAVDAAAVAFVDAMERGEDPDKTALSPEAMEAARREWTRRHPKAKAS